MHVITCSCSESFVLLFINLEKFSKSGAPFLLSNNFHAKDIRSVSALTKYLPPAI